MGRSDSRSGSVYAPRPSDGTDGAERFGVRRPRLDWAALRALLVQAILLGALFWLYRLARHLADNHPREAVEHALSLWQLERRLWLPNEAWLQSRALEWEGWVRPANAYYVSVHFPLTALFLVWTFWRHRQGWPRVRAVLVALTAVALLIQVLYPLAPPRFLPGGHLLDTMATYGPDAYGAAPGESMANQYAAMPSLHVGWALLVAWGVIRYSNRRWRWISVVHPVVTTLVVVLTANHYWLDGAVGTLLFVLAVVVTRRMDRRPYDRPIPDPDESERRVHSGVTPALDGKRGRGGPTPLRRVRFGGRRPRVGRGRGH